MLANVRARNDVTHRIFAMEDRNEKFSEMAVKNPSKAVFYGMGLAVIFLIGLWGKKELRISELETELSQAKAEAKKEASEQTRALISIYIQQIKDEKDKNQKQEVRVLELNDKVESLLTKSSANDKKYRKIENKIDRINTETKKIEEVIRQ